MPRFRLAALVAWLALLCATFTVLAQDTVTPTDAVVHRVNVRRFPSTGTTKVIGNLAPGENATLLDDVPGWYRVRLQDGTVGYVSKRWTRLEAEPTAPVAPPPSAGVPFTLHVVDVGNGDAILLDLGDQEMLIDGGMHAGPLRDYVSSVDVIQDPIELAVVTHADSDHWKGMEALIERYPLTVEEFWEPGYDRGCSPTDAYTAFIANMENAIPASHYMRPLAEAHTPVSVDDTGPQWFTVDHLQGVEFLLLHTDAAPDGPSCAFKINNASIVFKLRVGGVTFLFTGDANGKRIEDDPMDPPKYVEEELMALEGRFPGILRADVLKVSHHGSETASTDAFLRAVQPRIALISASPTHELPKETVIARLQEIGADVFNTGESLETGDDPIVCEGVGDGSVECGFVATP